MQFKRGKIYFGPWFQRSQSIARRLYFFRILVGRMYTLEKLGGGKTPTEWQPGSRKIGKNRALGFLLPLLLYLTPNLLYCGTSNQDKHLVHFVVLHTFTEKLGHIQSVLLIFQRFQFSKVARSNSHSNRQTKYLKQATILNRL